MLGFSAAAMNAYQNGSPSALEGEAEQTRDVPTANLATGLVDKAKALQQSTAWEDKTREKAVVLKDTMQKLEFPTHNATERSGGACSVA